MIWTNKLCNLLFYLNHTISKTFSLKAQNANAMPSMSTITMPTMIFDVWVAKIGITWDHFLYLFSMAFIKSLAMTSILFILHSPSATFSPSSPSPRTSTPSCYWRTGSCSWTTCWPALSACQCPEYWCGNISSFKIVMIYRILRAVPDFS